MTTLNESAVNHLSQENTLMVPYPLFLNQVSQRYSGEKNLLTVLINCLGSCPKVDIV